MQNKLQKHTQKLTQYIQKALFELGQVVPLVIVSRLPRSKRERAGCCHGALGVDKVACLYTFSAFALVFFSESRRVSAEFPGIIRDFAAYFQRGLAHGGFGVGFLGVYNVNSVVTRSLF